MPDRIQPTGEISTGFFILNLGFVSSYVFDAGDSLVAFDSGMNPNKVLSEMKKLNLDPAKVSTILFTHSDPDHTGCLLYTSPSPRDRTRSRMPSSA